MESRLAALGIPCVCQNFSLFGPGRKALRQVHDAMHFLTPPSSRRTEMVRLEASGGIPKFMAKFCLGEIFWLILSNTVASVSLYTHKPIYNFLSFESIM